MFKKIIAISLFAFLVMLSGGIVSAQGPTPTSGFGSFFDSFGNATPTSGSSSSSSSSSSSGSSFGASQTPTPNPVAQTLTQANYVVYAAGNWYDAQGKIANDSVYVMMQGVSADPKSSDSIKQITSGLAALVDQYPNAATFHVLLLNGPYVHDASTTAKTLQLLNSRLLTPENFLKDLLAQIRTTNLVSGASSGATGSATTPSTSAGATATRAPTRKPTTSSCTPPAGQARLWVKNGYSGVMRFTIGAPDVGFQKDFDIPADGQFHYIDLPPSAKYTYSASIPGVGKASQRLADIFGPFVAGQCYYLPFQSS